MKVQLSLKDTGCFILIDKKSEIIVRARKILIYTGLIQIVFLKYLENNVNHD